MSCMPAKYPFNVLSIVLTPSKPIRRTFLRFRVTVAAAICIFQGSDHGIGSPAGLGRGRGPGAGFVQLG